MINANELRIGNWIYQDGYVQLDEKFLTKFFRSFSYKELFPISLTTEILESSGFRKVKSSDDNTDFFQQQFCGSVTFVLTKEKLNPEGSLNLLFEVELNAGEGYNVLSINPPRYLHQLQNLVFSLTGEELKVKSLITG